MGKKEDQAARAAQLAKAAADPAYARWRFGGAVDPKAARKAGGSGQHPRPRKPAARDLEYRRALGLADDAPLPKKLGAAQSGGAARGGRGASSKGRGRYS